MVIEVLLIILGVLTFCLGLWNLIIGAYIWGSLFLISGLWSIWLGIVYIIQLRKQKKKEKEAVESTHPSEFSDDQLTESDNLQPQTESFEISDNLFDLGIQTNEFENAVTFTNEEISTPSVNSAEFDSLYENSQLTTEEYNDLDPDIKVIQDLIKNEDQTDLNKN